MESILTSIKKNLGIADDYTHFDADVIMHINSALSRLRQLGIGPTDGFRITGVGEVWEDFLGDDIRLESVKSYVYLKASLIFDPPTSSAVLAARERMIKEYEWCFTVDADEKIGGIR